MQISSLRGCSTKWDRVSTSDLVVSIAYRLILIAELKSRATTFMRLSPLLEPIHPTIPRPHTLCATTVSSSPHRSDIFSHLSPFGSSSSCSSLFAPLCSTFGAKMYFQVFSRETGDDDPPGSLTTMSMSLAWIFYLLK